MLERTIVLIIKMVTAIVIVISVGKLETLLLKKPIKFMSLSIFGSCDAVYSEICRVCQLFGPKYRKNLPKLTSLTENKKIIM